MRPQHNAAENPFTQAVGVAVMDASMRPQHNAAENQYTAVEIEHLETLQ